MSIWQDAILEEYGYDDIVETCECEGWVFDSIVPGICVKCGWINNNVEPDARNYTCDDGCGNTVSSVLILMGVM